MRFLTFANVVSGAVCAEVMWCVPLTASAQISHESAKWIASDGAKNDQFGASVSVSGDVAIVGAYSHDGNGVDSGAAYVFRRNGSAWALEQTLLPSDLTAGDSFGASVSVSGDVALIGASQDDDNGSAYVFRWNGASWVEEDKLLASDGQSDDGFGFAVSVAGDVALVGATFDDDNGQSSGAAYVFRWDGSSWTQEQKLLAFDGGVGPFFGNSVALAGDVAVVGAFAANNDSDVDSGLAYVFRWNASIWVEEQKLVAGDGALGDFFGRSVSIAASGDVIIVGADHDDGDHGGDSGSAYVFRWSPGAPGSWVQEQKLVPAVGAPPDQFGASVSVFGDTAVIGANFNGDGGIVSGSAYVFRHNGSSWVELQRLRPSDAASNDQFGWSVSLSGEVAVVGAYSNDGNSPKSGAAYVFDRVESCVDGVCIPTTSEWGLVTLALALLIAATIVLRGIAPA